MIIQFSVNRRTVNGNIRVCFLKCANPLRSRHQTHQSNGSRFPTFQTLHRRNGRVARGQHRIQHNQVATPQGFGSFEIVLHRFERLMVPVNTDMRHPGGRKDLEHPIQQTHPRPQNRNQDHLFPFQDGSPHPLHRGDNHCRSHRQISGNFVPH